MVGDIHPNIIKPHRCQRLLNGWLYPCLTLLPFGSHAQNLLHQPVAETLEGLIHTGGHYPRLRLKQKHRLHHRKIKIHRCSPICSLPPPKLHQWSPLLLRPLFNDITIGTYKWGILLKFILKDGVYINRSLTWTNVELVATIQCCLSTRKIPPHKQQYPTNIVNIYVVIFGNSLQFWILMYICIT